MEYITDHLVQSLKAYQLKMGYDFSKMSTEERMTTLRDYNTALVVELGELLDEVPWKPWRTKASQGKVNQRKVALEWCDCLIFLMDMGFSLNLDSELINEALEVKIKAINNRIATGYSKVKEP
jgi:dimeric dUTPase (all-alpha-NTP-PPase superfamily)